MVSIIVPCFNQAEYLPATLDSVLSQTYSDWECVVVDDGSPDNSSEIVERYVAKDNRFKLIKQDNHGLSAARNCAIHHSNGEYVLPLDSDDVLSPLFLEKAVAIIEQGYKLVYSKVDLFGEVNGPWELPYYSYEELLWTNILVCTALFRRADYDKTNGYNDNMRCGLEDWDFWLSFLQPQDKVFRINETLFYYRVKSLSRTTNAVEMSKELKRQIFLNHREAYEPYVVDIISEHMDKRWLEMELNRIMNSRSFRIGHAIVAPFGKVRQFIVNCLSHNSK